MQMSKLKSLLSEIWLRLIFPFLLVFFFILSSIYKDMEI